MASRTPPAGVDYEKFDYVPIGRESVETQERIGAAPGDELYRWLSNDRYTATYLLISRGMQQEAEAIGSLPAHFLPTIEAELRGDSRFEIYLENPDAIVFTVVPT